MRAAKETLSLFNGLMFFIYKIIYAISLFRIPFDEDGKIFPKHTPMAVTYKIPTTTLSGRRILNRNCLSNKWVRNSNMMTLVTVDNYYNESWLSNSHYYCGGKLMFVWILMFWVVFKEISDIPKFEVMCLNFILDRSTESKSQDRTARV